MDLDLCVISAVLRDKHGYYSAKKDGIKVSMFEGPAAKGWSFIDDHVLEHGAVPSVEFFEAKAQIDTVKDVSETLSVLLKELKKRSLWNKIRAAHESAGEFLEQQEPNQAIEVFQTAINDSYKDGIFGGKVGSLLACGDDVIDHYTRIKNGERGVLTPWGSLNEMTLGWWGGDLIVFVARMGVGKTFALLMLARQAWMEGKKVLFVGTEMSRTKLALRFYSIHLKLPYNEMRRGQLGDFREKQMVDAIKSMRSDTGIDVVGDDFDADISEIDAAIAQTRPDILLVDGLYLVKNEGRDRHAKVSNTADDLKRMARRHSIPIVASTQFNRDVAGNSRSAIDVANVGITDVISWNSDVLIGMYQTEDMKDDSIMGMRPMKLREGDGSDFFCKWDFNKMDFHEESSEGKSFNDDDYNSVSGVVSGDVDTDDGGLF